MKDILTGEIIDPFCGIEDLKNKKLKHILILAKEKNVEVEEFDFKAYSCCGIIKNMKDV